MSKRVETDSLRVFHASFHSRQTRQNSTIIPLQGHQIDTDLANDGLNLADIGSGRADIAVKLADVDMKLINSGLDLAHITLKKRFLGPHLLNMSPELDNLGLEMGEICLQTSNIGPGSVGLVGSGVDTASNFIEFATDEPIFPVSSFNIGIFGENGGTEVEDFRIELVETVVDVEEGGIGDSRRGDFALDGQSGTAHAARSPEQGVSLNARHGGRDIAPSDKRQACRTR